MLIMFCFCNSKHISSKPLAARDHFRLCCLYRSTALANRSDIPFDLLNYAFWRKHRHSSAPEPTNGNVRAVRCPWHVLML